MGEVLVTKNKRGRKTKMIDFNRVQVKDIQYHPQIDDTIILSLPITINDIYKMYNNSDNLNKDLNIKKNINDNKINNLNIKNVKDKRVTNIVNTNGDSVSINLYDNIKVLDTKQSHIYINEYSRFNVSNNTFSKIQCDNTDYLNPKINIDKIVAAKTDLNCWWCCNKFETYPICLPISYNKNIEIFKVIGCFCSFNCAKSYGREKRIRDISLLSYLSKILTGKFMNIKYAPCKSVLKEFGGILTIDEYRESFVTLTEYHINTYPMIFIQSQIEEHEILKHRHKNSMDINKDKNVVKRISNKNNENNGLDEVDKYMSKKQSNLLRNINVLNPNVDTNGISVVNRAIKDNKSTNIKEKVTTTSRTSLIDKLNKK